MTCPQCKKHVPQRYREDHARNHLGLIENVSLAAHIQSKTMWGTLKLITSAKKEKENKKSKLEGVT
jgi:hypothetical protein